jgi:hypothetical protein
MAASEPKHLQATAWIGVVALATGYPEDAVAAIANMERSIRHCRAEFLDAMRWQDVARACCAVVDLPAPEQAVEHVVMSMPLYELKVQMRQIVEEASDG